MQQFTACTHTFLWLDFSLASFKRDLSFVWVLKLHFDSTKASTFSAKMTEILGGDKQMTNYAVQILWQVKGLFSRI